MSEPIVIRVFHKEKLIAVKQFEQNQVIIGKKGDAGLVIRHKDVADLHCVIEKRGDTYFLCDLGSETGTIIHNEKVLEHPLKSGDVFFINDLEVHFFIGTPTFTTPRGQSSASKDSEDTDSKAYVDDEPAATFEEPVEFNEPKVSTEEESPFISMNPKKTNFLKEKKSKKIPATQDSKNNIKSEKESEVQGRNNYESSAIKTDHQTTENDFSYESDSAEQNKSESISAMPKARAPYRATSVSGFEMMSMESHVDSRENLSEGIDYNLGTFAPQASHVDLDEIIDVNSRGSVVEVLLTWKERILSANHFDSKQKVHLGNKPDCELQLSILDFKHYFINIGNGAEIRIPSKMDGFLYRGQQRIPFSTLKKSGQLQQDGDNYILTLGQGEMVRCFLMGQNIQAYVRYVEQTPKAMPIAVFDFTSSELVAIVSSFVISVLIAIYMTFHAPHNLDEIDTLVEDQYRIATVEFSPPPRRVDPSELIPPKEEPIPEKKVVKKVSDEKKKVKPIAKNVPTTKVPQKQSLGKKGKPKKVKVVDQEKGAPKEVAPNASKIKNNKVVSNKSGGAVGTGKEGANAATKKKDVTKSGLLSVLSSGGAASNLDKAYSGAGTTFGLADKATGFGGQTSDRQGEGLGTDLKNVGAGGKGTSTIGISGVGSKGRGGGETSYGGNGGLGDKGTMAIVNIEGNSNDFISSIDKEAIRRIIRSNRSAIKSCYDLELTKNPTLSGKVVLQWQITNGGKMINAKVKSNDMNSNSLGPCIINRLRVLKFPDPGPVEIAEVAFPFVFEAR